MSPDIRRGEPLREHEHLQVVDELRDLLRRLGVGLELGRLSDLGSLFDDLLADRVHTRVELGDGARPGRPRHRLVAQLSEELVEGFHPYSVSAARRPGRPAT